MNLGKYVVAGIAVLMLNGHAYSEMRIWHIKSGVYFEGEFERESLGKFYFSQGKGKKSISVDEANLVAKDLEYIRTMIPPKISIKVSSKTSAASGTYADPNEEVTTTDLTISKVSKEEFKGVLRAEFYMVAKEVAGPEHVVVGKEIFPVKFPDDGNEDFEYSMTVRTSQYADRIGDVERGRNYEGYAVFVFGPGGKILGMKTDLGWLDDEKIEAFRQFDVMSFFDDECRRKSTPRPPYTASRDY